MIKLIIFDWDDVFTHGSIEGYYAVVHETLKALGVELDRDEEIRRIKVKWGSTLPIQFEELLKEKPELIGRAVDKYTELLMSDVFVGQLTLVEGSVELIKRLFTKYKLAIASGTNPDVLRQRVFPKFSIPNLFSEIITVYDLENPLHAKPHAFMAEEIMRRRDIKPSETVLVGDANNDVSMALNAGVTPIVVLTGHLNREQSEEMGVKYIIDDVTKLEEVLDRLNQSAS
ncbi:MAG TPA: HAD family hydrolase [Candidatus Saccharimonadales bacterium]|nr:HAD family hydrolase [Candidatus Saccharimonadales bacterium]